MWRWITERLFRRRRQRQINFNYRRAKDAYDEALRRRSLTAQIALDFDEAIGKPGQRAEIILFASMNTLPTYALEWSQQNLKEVPTVFGCGTRSYFKFSDDNDALAFKMRWL